MVVYDKIYFEALINKEYICLKNNTAKLYVIVGRANLHRNFSSIPKDGSDIHRFHNKQWVLTICTVRNL